MTPEGNQRRGRIRAIIFDMDNALFDFVAAKQHACREVAKSLGREDGEAFQGTFLGACPYFSALSRLSNHAHMFMPTLRDSGYRKSQ